MEGGCTGEALVEHGDPDVPATIPCSIPVSWDADAQPHGCFSLEELPAAIEDAADAVAEINTEAEKNADDDQQQEKGQHQKDENLEDAKKDEDEVAVEEGSPVEPGLKAPAKGRKRDRQEHEKDHATKEGKPASKAKSKAKAKADVKPSAPEPTSPHEEDPDEAEATTKKKRVTRASTQRAAASSGGQRSLFDAFSVSTKSPKCTSTQHD